MTSTNIYTCIDRTPYTYLIGWSHLNVWYYGLRYGKNCHPDDLWVKYFSSSKQVKHFRKEHGEPDVVQIRRTFSDVTKAKLWENKVLRKVYLRDDFLNISISATGGIDYTNPKWKAAMLAGLARYWDSMSAEERHEFGMRSGCRKGYKQSQEHIDRKKCVGSRNGMYGKTHSDEWKAIESKRQKLMAALQGDNHQGTINLRKSATTRLDNGTHIFTKQMTCPHCNITTTSGNYFRWHGDRCKHQAQNE